MGLYIGDSFSYPLTIQCEEVMITLTLDPSMLS